MPETRQVIIGTAGHIDHGKTALVKALTGIDADTLAEEKRRGITIELGFVFMPPASDEARQIVFIDVPGHERLVRTMVAGAANLDAAMLVIAADEGIMPQTREHLEILQLLGMKHGLIALTKSDLVDEEWLAATTDEVRNFVDGSFLEGAPIIPVSAVTGAGLDDLRAALQTLAAQAETRRGGGPFRMPIDRVFTMQGFGTVIAGTVLSGQIKVGEQVQIYPEGFGSRVRGIQIHNEKAAESQVGKRTALNLPELKKEDLRRGQTAATPGSLTPTYRLDAQLSLLPDAGEIKHRTRLRLHIGTDEVITRLTLLDRERLLPGETVVVQFALEAPTVAVPQDRFVVRTFSPLRTIGGGVILDANPPRHKRFDEGTLSGLSRLEGDLLEVVAQQLLQSAATPVTGAELATTLGRDEQEVADALAELVQRDEAILLDPRQQPPRALHAQVWGDLRNKVVGLLETFYERNHYRLWMPLSDLQAQAAKLAPRPVAEAVMAELEREGVLQRRDLRVRLAHHQIEFTPPEQKLAEQVATLYEGAGLASPSEDEAREQLKSAPAIFAGVVTALLEQDVLVRLSDKVIYHARHLGAVRDLVRREITRRGSLTVAELRDLTGVSRKYTLAIMEYFDATGFTQRSGDARVLAEH